jgi:short subunit dehydrogenase-like uncharacterized protein
MPDRPLDVVVLGATGFAGCYVIEYLAEHHPDAAWALAGRSADKLARTRDRVAERWPAVADKPLIVADSHDRESLDALARQTRAVCTTVGPYQRHGHDLVAACVDAGTHYCDLTGEVPFIRDSIDAHHQTAAADGTRIVHACGFDSIPSDLGTFVLLDAVSDRDGEPPDEVLLTLRGASGGFSGGTIASLLTVLERSGEDPEVRRTVDDPYALNPDGVRGPEAPDRLGARRDPLTGTWLGPFVMASINTRVVRRSVALRDPEQAARLHYDEAMALGSGLGGALAARAFALGFGLFLGAAAWAPTRRLLQTTILPAPGQGPSRKTVEEGYFRLRLSARRQGRALGHVDVTGEGDPGYGATACMLAESALCLAQDDLDSPGGVLTPSTAMGHALVKRLNETRVRFETHPG